MSKLIPGLTMLPLALLCNFASAQDVLGKSQDPAATVSNAAAPQTPALKTITNFSQPLRCMDEFLLSYGKIYIFRILLIDLVDGIS